MISVTLFSLRGNSGCGIGDMGNLINVIDIAAILGQKHVVVSHAIDYAFGKGLPLLPAYIDLNMLPPLANRSKEAALAAQASAMEKEEDVNYSKSYNVKMHYLGEMFLQEGERMLSSEDYHGFWKDNGNWLEQYAVYCSLRHKYGTGDNRFWSEPDYTRLLEDRNFLKEYSDDIRFHCFVQFLLCQQAEKVRAYAIEKGIEIEIRNIDPQPSFRKAWSQYPAEKREETYRNLGFTGNAPEYPEPWIAESRLRHRMNAAEAIPMEDLLALTTLTRNLPPAKEIINPPLNQPSAWHYRMDITLEDILSHRALLDCIRTIIADSIK